MKLCLIYNFAHHYRSAIFQEIDKAFDCDFYFGDSYLDVKKMDYTLLMGKVKEVHNIRWHSFYYQKDIIHLLKENYDVYLIFSQIWSLSTWLFLLKAKFIDKKNVYAWAHGWYGKESAIVSFLKHVLYSLPTGVFFYGNHSRDIAIKCGLNSSRLYVVHNSLDYKKQIVVRQNLNPSDVYKEHFHNENGNIVFIGRLTQNKKLEMLIKAVNELKNRGEYYNLTFIGTGEMRHELEHLSENLGLSNDIWFYGECYDEKSLATLLYNADVCVSPGNVGLTAIHALTYGTPVITHDNLSMQMPEVEAVKEGETGSFFKYGQVDSLADCISKWFADKGRHRKEVRKQCMKETDENWTPEYQIKVFKAHLK